jgi:hypothetical protein
MHQMLALLEQKLLKKTSVRTRALYLYGII